VSVLIRRKMEALGPTLFGVRRDGIEEAAGISKARTNQSASFVKPDLVVSHLDVPQPN
jgi:hypothetical protein